MREESWRAVARQAVVGGVLIGIVCIGCCLFPPEPELPPAPVTVVDVDPAPVIVNVDVPTPELPVPPPSQILYPTVQVRDRDRGTTCTGFVVVAEQDFAFVVTAFHCIDLAVGDHDNNEYKLPTHVEFWKSDDEVPVTQVVLARPELDFVILETGVPLDVPVVAATLALGDPEPLEPSITVGVFGGIGPVAFLGLVGDTGARTNGLIPVAAYVFRGQSGGPVYRLEDGEWRVWGLTSLAPILFGRTDAHISLIRPTTDLIIEAIGL